MTLKQARVEFYKALVKEGVTEEQAVAATAALCIAGPLAEGVPEWIPKAFAQGAREPARDIARAILLVESSPRHFEGKPI